MPAVDHCTLVWASNVKPERRRLRKAVNAACFHRHQYAWLACDEYAKLGRRGEYYCRAVRHGDECADRDDSAHRYANRDARADRNCEASPDEHAKARAESDPKAKTNRTTTTLVQHWWRSGESVVLYIQRWQLYLLPAQRLLQLLQLHRQLLVEHEWLCGAVPGRYVRPFG